MAGYALQFANNGGDTVQGSGNVPSNRESINSPTVERADDASGDCYLDQQTTGSPLGDNPFVSSSSQVILANLRACKSFINDNQQVLKGQRAIRLESKRWPLRDLRLLAILAFINERPAHLLLLKL